jgi:hypothetical protein
MADDHADQPAADDRPKHAAPAIATRQRDDGASGHDEAEPKNTGESKEDRSADALQSAEEGKQADGSQVGDSSEPTSDGEPTDGGESAGSGGAGNGGKRAADREKTDVLASAHQAFNGAFVNFYPSFGASVTGGEGGSKTRAAKTGTIRPDEISRALDHFVTPDLFDEAVEALRTSRTLILSGAVGSGKRASSIAMLRQVTNGTLAMLLPTVSASELADRKYEEGLGYAVFDWQVNGRLTGSQDFAWRTIRDQVSDAGAFLVVTTSSTSIDAGDAIPLLRWSPPSAEAILAEYLANREDQPDPAEIASQIPDGCALTSIVSLARSLAGGADTDKALEKLSEDAPEQVSKWIKDRPLTEILEVAALAFTAGLNERVFEALLGGLEQAVEKLESTGRPRPRKAAKKSRSLNPRRAERNRADGVMTRKLVAAEGSFRGIVDFQVPAFRRHFLAEMCATWDYRFWDIVRESLGSLVTAAATDSTNDVHVAIAAGLKDLAFTDLDEVEGAYLDPWAAGEIGWPGQMTATFVLWYMSLDDALAPTALRIAKKWVNGKDAAGAWTAAMALSGDLGVAYPLEAAKQLWQIITRAGIDAEAIDAEAIGAFGKLFALLTSLEQNTKPLLDLLSLRLKKFGRNFADPRMRIATHLTVVSTLTVKDLRSGQPAVALLIRGDHKYHSSLAKLWAQVLSYAPWRREALSALFAAISALEHVCSNPADHARAFGDALAAHIPVELHARFINDFTNLQAHSKKRGHPRTTEIMRSLIAALETVKNRGEGK